MKVTTRSPGNFPRESFIGAKMESWLNVGRKLEVSFFCFRFFFPCLNMEKIDHVEKTGEEETLKEDLRRFENCLYKFSCDYSN